MKTELTKYESYEAPLAECIELKLAGGLLVGSTEGSGNGGDIPYPGGNPTP